MAQPSPMSITQLCNSASTNDDNEERHRSSPLTSAMSIDHNDPDVRLAAEALGDMAKATTTQSVNSNSRPIMLPLLSTYPSAPSTTSSSPLPTPTSSSLSNSRLSFSSDSSMTTQEDEFVSKRHLSQHFIHRMSDLPLVNSALRAYENTKQSNGMVRYGVEMVESFAAPIYGKFGRATPSEVPEAKERLRQSSVNSVEQQEDEAALAAASALARASLTDHHEPREGLRRRRTEEPCDDVLHGKKSRSRSASRSTSPHRPYTVAANPAAVRHHPQPVPRSRWQQIVMHAGSAAGTTAAVVSEESMKCLRYCLSWLQYATQHIERQMNLLRQFLVSLATDASNGNSKSTAVTTASSASSTLSAIKKEIIGTLRKVVDVVSKYAGSGLPEQAKASVRSFILALPGRWATLNTSTTASPAASPVLGPRAPPHVQETSIKLLTFGDESLVMLNSVARVFSETIERAELWLERLRVVGVAGPSAHRQQQPRQLKDNNEQPSSEPAIPLKEKESNNMDTT